MDTPSKERLVGAIIFVMLIVLLVPEILSGPRGAVPADGSALSPSLRTYTIDLGNPVKPIATPAADAKPPALPPPTATNKEPAATDSPASATLAATIPTAPPVAATTATAIDVGPATETAGAAKTRESWGAQLGSFSKAANAERLATTLRAKGYRAFVSPTGSGSHVLHRVRVGPEPTREAAEALIARLKQEGQSASVVTIP